MASLSKKEALERAHNRVRKKVKGSSQRPRLAVHKSGKNIYAQIIDDTAGITLVAASSLETSAKCGANCEAAQVVGKLIAEKATKKQIKQVVFDRGGHLYHGRIKAIAEAAREAGLEF